jgi:hypothetical protein
MWPRNGLNGRLVVLAHTHTQIGKVTLLFDGADGPVQHNFLVFLSHGHTFGHRHCI